MPKLTKNFTEQGPAAMKVGIDIGYGWTKVVSEYGECLFPSVMGRGQELSWERDIDPKYYGERLYSDGDLWYVGSYAVKQVPPKQLQSLQGRIGNEDEIGMAFRVRLFKTAMAKLNPNARNGDVITVHLCTGLPVKHMADAEVIKKWLKKEHLVKTPEAEFIVNVATCRVIPQPMGTIYSEVIDATGQLRDTEEGLKTVVADIGRYTIDCTLDDDGEFVDAQSDSDAVGVYSAETRIAAAMSGMLHDELKWEHINTLLRDGYLKQYGERVYYKEQVERALQPLRDATVSLLNRLYGTGFDIDVIYLSGGGAELVAQVVQNIYPQARVISDPQMSNARGYLNYVRWKMRG